MNLSNFNRRLAELTQRHDPPRIVVPTDDNPDLEALESDPDIQVILITWDDVNQHEVEPQ